MEEDKARVKFESLGTLSQEAHLLQFLSAPTKSFYRLWPTLLLCRALLRGISCSHRDPFPSPKASQAPPLI